MQNFMIELVSPIQQCNNITMNQNLYIENYSMKTEQSLFPTNTKSKASLKKQVSYTVLKKVLDDNDIQTEQRFSLSKNMAQAQCKQGKVENIFRDNNNLIKSIGFDQNLDRPIGGIELFSRMQKSNNSGIEESGRKLSKKGSKKNIKESRQKFFSNYPKLQPFTVIPQKDKNAEQFRSQTFKEHSDCKQTYTFTPNNYFSASNSVAKYQSHPYPLTQNLRKTSANQSKFGKNSTPQSVRSKENIKIRAQTRKSSSVQSLKHPNQTDRIHLKWAQSQQQKYLDKMAILNEINNNRPLIQKLGNRYFQGILRNRYMDEPQYKHKSPYIYQIKDKLSDTKFITKIKTMKCNFMQRNKIVLKGKSKKILEQQDKKDYEQVQDSRKRWQQFSQDNFDY